MKEEESLSDKEGILCTYPREDVKQKINDFIENFEGMIKTWHVRIETYPLIISETKKLALKHFGNKLIKEGK